MAQAKAGKSLKQHHISGSPAAHRLLVRAQSSRMRARLGHDGGIQTTHLSALGIRDITADVNTQHRCVAELVFCLVLKAPAQTLTGVRTGTT